MGDALFAAKPQHCRGTLDAQTRLERSWPVIDAGVDYATVVAALVLCNSMFLFQDGDAKLREPAG